MAKTLAELQRIQVAASPTPGQGLALDLSGKVARSVLPQQVTGIVTSAGVVTAGTGYTASRLSAGRYTITFNPAFAAAPAVTPTAISTTGNETVTINASTTTAVQVNVNDAGVAVDRAFHFVAVAVA